MIITERLIKDHPFQTVPLLITQDGEVTLNMKFGQSITIPYQCKIPYKKIREVLFSAGSGDNKGSAFENDNVEITVQFFTTDNRESLLLELSLKQVKSQPLNPKLDLHTVIDNYTLTYKTERSTPI